MRMKYRVHIDGKDCGCAYPVESNNLDSLASEYYEKAIIFKEHNNLKKVRLEIVDENYKVVYLKEIDELGYQVSLF